MIYMIKFCRKCGKPFNSWETINGKRINLGKRIFCLECSPYPSKNHLSLDKVQEDRFCSVCGKSITGNQTKFCSKECSNKNYAIMYNLTERRRNKKLVLVKLKGGRCSICGYDKCIEALQFHHIQGKDFNIGLHMDKSLKSLTKEVEKCILICSNCHIEIHSKTLNKKTD